MSKKQAKSQVAKDADDLFKKLGLSQGPRREELASLGNSYEAPADSGLTVQFILSQNSTPYR